ncbi:MAG: YybS family protein [Alphaproteobacteria bacterium]|nr:YybS family protein [Alphaproteobacteria bacterium]
MRRETLIAIAAGGISALLTLSVATGSVASVFFVYLAPLPLMIVGLGFGSKMVVFAAASGAVAAFATSGLLAAVFYTLINGLPAVLVARQALLSRVYEDENGETITNWYPPGPILAMLAAMGATLLLLATFLTSGSEGGIEGVIGATLSEGFAAMAPQLSEEERGNIIKLLVPGFPAAVAVSWLVMTVINGVLAQWVLARSEKALRPSPKMADFDLPGWASWALVGAGVLALIGEGQIEYLGENLTVILAVPFFFLGLGVFHALARNAPSPGMLLAAFYMLLFVVSAWAALVVAGLGFIEQWARLRQRYAAAADNGPEDE